MGNSGSSGAFATCLNTVCAGRDNCVGYPSDLFYQAHWVKRYNLAYDVTPAAVVRPQSAQEVAAFVKCAAASGVGVQARAGGHSYANFGLGGTDGALAIDLVNLDAFSMNTSSWEATIGPGARLGSIDEKLAAQGNRAFAHGTCPDVGLGGHATIGGLGPMSRMWGSCADHIVEVEVVTATGELVRASADANEDLYWAVRGAASSFGIVTEFVMRTHPSPADVVQYSFRFNFGDGAELADVFLAWQDIVFEPGLDVRYGTEFVLYELGAIITGTFYGTQAEWEASGIPARLPSGNGTAVVNSWLASLAEEAKNEALYTAGGIPVTMYSKTIGFRAQDKMPADTVRALFEYADTAAKGTIAWFIIFDASGGVMLDMPVDASAYPHRDKAMFYQSYGIDLLPLSDATSEFVAGFDDTLHSMLPANATQVRGKYSGYVDNTLSSADAQQAYYLTNLPRLKQIKKKWDPQQVFRNPQSVEPA